MFWTINDTQIVIDQNKIINCQQCPCKREEATLKLSPQDISTYILQPQQLIELQFNREVTNNKGQILSNVNFNDATLSDPIAIGDNLSGYLSTNHTFDNEKVASIISKGFSGVNNTSLEVPDDAIFIKQHYWIIGSQINYITTRNNQIVQAAEPTIFEDEPTVKFTTLTSLTVNFSLDNTVLNPFSVTTLDVSLISGTLGNGTIADPNYLLNGLTFELQNNNDSISSSIIPSTNIIQISTAIIRSDQILSENSTFYYTNLNYSASYTDICGDSIDDKISRTIKCRVKAFANVEVRNLSKGTSNTYLFEGNSPYYNDYLGGGHDITMVDQSDGDSGRQKYYIGYSMGNLGLCTPQISQYLTSYEPGTLNLFEIQDLKVNQNGDEYTLSVYPVYVVH